LARESAVALDGNDAGAGAVAKIQFADGLADHIWRDGHGHYHAAIRHAGLTDADNSIGIVHGPKAPGLLTPYQHVGARADRQQCWILRLSGFSVLILRHGDIVDRRAVCCHASR
jgi:hypothetical protein